MLWIPSATIKVRLSEIIQMSLFCPRKLSLGFLKTAFDIPKGENGQNEERWAEKLCGGCVANTVYKGRWIWIVLGLGSPSCVFSESLHKVLFWLRVTYLSWCSKFEAKIVDSIHKTFPQKARQGCGDSIQPLWLQNYNIRWLTTTNSSRVAKYKKFTLYYR